MRRSAIGIGGLAAAFAYFALSAVPAIGLDRGSVSAQVTAAAPCLTVAPAARVDFGTASFSTSGGLSAPVSDAISFTNCTAAPQRIYVRGDDATGDDGVSWTLDELAAFAQNPCELSSPENRYGLFILTPIAHRISKTNAAFQEPNLQTDYYFPAGETSELRTVLTMPCTGSDGLGATMAFTINFTAAF